MGRAALTLLAILTAPLVVPALAAALQLPLAVTILISLPVYIVLIDLIQPW